MGSVLDSTKQALRREGPGAAVSVIESHTTSGEDSLVVICRSALLVLGACQDARICERLAGALSRIKARFDQSYLADLVLSLCNLQAERIAVDVARLRDSLGAHKSRDHGVLAVWEAMDLFNHERGRDAIDILLSVHQAKQNLWVRDVLMKAYLRTAYYHIAKERYERAAEVLRESLKIDSYNEQALHTLAILETERTSLSSLDQIESTWRRLVDIWRALDKINPDAGYRHKIICKHKYFAARFMKAGSWAMAKRELTDLIDIDPGNDLAEEVLAAISS